jgi:hypothetical protein
MKIALCRTCRPHADAPFTCIRRRMTTRFSASHPFQL